MAHSHKAMPRAQQSGVSALRFVVVCLALLTFTLQSYVTQTHIHVAADSIVSTTGKKLPDRFPANGDPAKCPLCQEALHSGQYVTPASAALVAPQLSAQIIPAIVEPAIRVLVVSHAWRSRAPPPA